MQHIDRKPKISELARPDELSPTAKSVMSNFDGSIDREMEAQLRQGRHYAQYAAWNFCGYVWFQDRQFHCEIWTHHVHRETISADRLAAIMQLASERFGDA